MKRLLQACLLASGLFVIPASPADQPAVVFIGTNQYQPVNIEVAEAYGVQLAVFNLDDHRNLERMLSENLPADLEQAERIANERLQALDHQQLQGVFRGIALALQWDIRKAPAFVFNEGEAVIYGLTDVSVALKRWEYYGMTR